MSTSTAGLAGSYDRFHELRSAFREIDVSAARASPSSLRFRENEYHASASPPFARPHEYATRSLLYFTPLHAQILVCGEAWLLIPSRTHHILRRPRATVERVQFVSASVRLLRSTVALRGRANPSS